MNLWTSPLSKISRARRMLARRTVYAAVLFGGMHSRGVVVRVGAARSIYLNFLSAVSIDDNPLRYRQSPFAFFAASRSHIPLFFTEDCNVGAAESIFLERSKNVIRGRDIDSHPLNDIMVRFQEEADDLLGVEIEKRPLIEKSSFCKRH